PTPNHVVQSIRRRTTRTAGQYGGPITLAHSILKLLYDGSQRRQTTRTATPGVKVGGAFESVLRLVFDRDSGRRVERLKIEAKRVYHKLAREWTGGGALGVTFEAVLESEVYALLSEHGFRERVKTAVEADERMFLVVGTLINRILRRYADNIRRHGG